MCNRTIFLSLVVLGAGLLYGCQSAPEASGKGPQVINLSLAESRDCRPVSAVEATVVNHRDREALPDALRQVREQAVAKEGNAVVLRSLRLVIGPGAPLVETVSADVFVCQSPQPVNLTQK
jgi:hypothetical protein